MVNSPSPESGVFTWAWYHAKEIRARFWVGAALFSLVVALIVSRVPLPKHPTATQNLIATALAIVGAAIMTGVGTYVCALVAAPLQQRNVLRSELSESAAKIAALQAAPVTRAHGDRLRQTAVWLLGSIEHHKPLDYGHDPGTWRRAFREHFPDLKPALDAAGEADATFAAVKARLKARLEDEATAAGMTAAPWVTEKLLPWLATTIQSRALERRLGTAYHFDWLDLASGVRIGDIYTVVLKASYHANVPALKNDFEEFFRRAESWPEAADIRSKWDQRHAAEQKAIELLAAVANTDPITSRCFLCRGSDSDSSGQE